MEYAHILQLAREHRKNPTAAEKFFWDKVRNRCFQGLKFNRQYVLEVVESKYFIVDFHCFEKKLVIELDGRIHDYQVEYDNGRSFEIEELGYTVIRFKNEEVLEDWNKVEKILMKIIS